MKITNRGSGEVMTIVVEANMHRKFIDTIAIAQKSTDTLEAMFTENRNR